MMAATKAGPAMHKIKVPVPVLQIRYDRVTYKWTSEEVKQPTFNQGCGSVFILSGSGSSILG
jgi:hypothetical protein